MVFLELIVMDLVGLCTWCRTCEECVLVYVKAVRLVYVSVRECERLGSQTAEQVI